MRKQAESMKISANLKAIENLKSSVLSEIASLYTAISAYEEKSSYADAASAVSTVIAMNYILARRLGIGYRVIDEKMDCFLAVAEDEGHELETEFSDMSALRKYLKSRGDK